MKKILFLLFILSVFVGCNNEEPSIPNDTVDYSILGAWQVVYSQTIKGVRTRPNGSLEIIDPEKVDTVTFSGIPKTAITSYMFGKDENIIDIRDDNKIRIYLINSKGGVTVSKEQASYFVRNDTLYRKNPNFETVHIYQTRNDSLIIERIPSEETAWTYILSKYTKTNL